MNLDALTSEQICTIIGNLAAELARRAQAPAQQKPQDPMQAMLLSLAQPHPFAMERIDQGGYSDAPAAQRANPPSPHFVPERTYPTGPEPKAKAFAGGMSGHGVPTSSLAAGPTMEALSRSPSSRGFPPGKVFATAATDPSLVQAFGLVPERTDEAVLAGTAPPMQGTGVARGAIDVEPAR